MTAMLDPSDAEEVRWLQEAFRELGMRSRTAMEDVETMDRRDRAPVIFWLDRYHETGDINAPLAHRFGRTVKLGETWREVIFRPRYPDDEKAQLVRRLPGAVRAAGAAWHVIGPLWASGADILRLVRVDAIVLLGSVLKRSFHVQASGAWWVAGQRIQKTNVRRSVANFVMSFERQEEK